MIERQRHTYASIDMIESFEVADHGLLVVRVALLLQRANVHLLHDCIFTRSIQLSIERCCCCCRRCYNYYRLLLLLLPLLLLLLLILMLPSEAVEVEVVEVSQRSVLVLAGVAVTAEGPSAIVMESVLLLDADSSRPCSRSHERRACSIEGATRCTSTWCAAAGVMVSMVRRA